MNHFLRRLDAEKPAMALPELGELIRFTQNTLCSWKRRRSSSARRWFFAQNLFFDGYTHVGSSNLTNEISSSPPATQRVTSLSHFGQAANSMCFELPPTSPTALYPLAKINLQDCILEWGGLCERFKREGNSLRINARKFADAQAHFDDAQAAVPCGLFRGPLQNGLRSSIAL